MADKVNEHPSRSAGVGADPVRSKDPDLWTVFERMMLMGPCGQESNRANISIFCKYPDSPTLSSVRRSPYLSSQGKQVLEKMAENREYGAIFSAGRYGGFHATQKRRLRNHWNHWGNFNGDERAVRPYRQRRISVAGRVVPRVGIEPTTRGFSVLCSTD